VKIFDDVQQEVIRGIERAKETVRDINESDVGMTALGLDFGDSE